MAVVTKEVKEAGPNIESYVETNRAVLEEIFEKLAEVDDPRGPYRSVLSQTDIWREDFVVKDASLVRVLTATREGTDERRTFVNKAKAVFRIWAKTTELGEVTEIPTREGGNPDEMTTTFFIAPKRGAKVVLVVPSVNSIDGARYVRRLKLRRRQAEVTIWSKKITL